MKFVLNLKVVKEDDSVLNKIVMGLLSYEISREIFTVEQSSF